MFSIAKPQTRIQSQDCVENLDFNVFIANNFSLTRKSQAVLCHFFVILILLVLLGEPLFAAENGATGTFVVSLVAKEKQKTWVVTALEQNIYNDLSGYEKIAPIKKSPDEEKCKNRKLKCILEIYKKLNVDALMFGTVDKSDLDYEIYDIQQKFLVKTGSIKIGKGSSLLKLRLGAFSAFKPFIEKGGILDKRKYTTSDIGEVNENNLLVEEKSDAKQKKQALIFMALFTCLPYFLSFFGKPRRHPERSRIILRWFYPFLIFCLIIIANQFTLEHSGKAYFFDISSELFDKYNWIVTGLGGIVWGYFLILSFKIVVPHLQGLERIKPINLVPLLQSCVLTIIVKSSILAVFYIGVYYSVSNLGALFSMNQENIVLLFFPMFGLYLFYWVALLLDVFSMSIDVELSVKNLNFNNVWNQHIQKYFISYLKRNGVTLHKRLVDNVVFIPGHNKAVVCYGGGFSRPRIAIEKNLLKFALGDIDEFDPEATVIFYKTAVKSKLRQISVFFIFANLSNLYRKRKWFKSRKIKKKVKQFERLQQLFQRDPKSQIKNHIGQTEKVMQGIVFPNLEGDAGFPSLMSDNVEEKKILEKLLHETVRYRYDEDAEIDDSSEKDKDFLFGALLLKFGNLLRHDDIFSTCYLYFSFKKDKQVRSYNFLFSKYFAIVADTFVVLNFGLNHLLQYLHYVATDDTTHITTKGLTSHLLTSQDNILTFTNEKTKSKKSSPIQTDELDRIVWLSRFCHDPIENRKLSNIRAKRIFRWSASISVTCLAALAIINSYNYHPTYNEIIENEKHQIADAIKHELETDRKEK